jgi:hypothetical protein
MIKLPDINFSLNGEMILDNISLHINKGECFYSELVSESLVSRNSKDAETSSALIKTL